MVTTSVVGHAGIYMGSASLANALANLNSASFFADY